MNTTVETKELTIEERLAKFLPIRVILQVENDKVEGLVENSFSMSWSDRVVNVFWSGKAYSMLGEHELDAIKWASGNHKKYKHNEFMIDPLAADSPIEVDWEKWLNATDKFSKRNAPFKLKPGGKFQLRAMTAERELAELKPQLANVIAQRDEAENKLDQLKQIMNPSTEDSDEDEYV